MKNLDRIHLQGTWGHQLKAKMAFITGDYANGKDDGGIIDLVLVGDINSNNLHGYVEKAKD